MRVNEAGECLIQAVAIRGCLEAHVIEMDAGMIAPLLSFDEDVTTVMSF